MKTPQIELDFTEIRRIFDTKDMRFMRMVQRGWQRAGMFFIGDIVKNQMSGRVRPSYGLNVVHGQLRRSWYPLTEVNASTGDVRTRVQTDSPYARIHQYGGIVKHPARERTLSFRRTRKGVRFARDKQVTSAGRVRKVFQRVVQTGAYEIKIPKRLYVIEAFKTSGLNLYVTELRQALRAFKRGAT